MVHAPIRSCAGIDHERWDVVLHCRADLVLIGERKPHIKVECLPLSCTDKIIPAHLKRVSADLRILKEVGSHFAFRKHEGVAAKQWRTVEIFNFCVIVIDDCHSTYELCESHAVCSGGAYRPGSDHENVDALVFRPGSLYGVRALNPFETKKIEDALAKRPLSGRRYGCLKELCYAETRRRHCAETILISPRCQGEGPFIRQAGEPPRGIDIDLHRRAMQIAFADEKRNLGGCRTVRDPKGSEGISVMHLGK